MIWKLVFHSIFQEFDPGSRSLIELYLITFLVILSLCFMESGEKNISGSAFFSMSSGSDSPPPTFQDDAQFRIWQNFLIKAIKSPL